MGAAEGGHRSRGGGRRAPPLRAGAALAAALVLCACGRTAPEPAPVLARGASPLCARVPRNPRLRADLGSGAPDPGLAPVAFGGPDGDGVFAPVRVGPVPALRVQPGADAAGGELGYEELYFTSGGAVPPGTGNVLLCLQYYDSPAGVDLEAQYSGLSPVGPDDGAYDAAPESYLTGGAPRWLVASFTFTDVRFAGGRLGPGRENAGADFRVDSRQARPWEAARAWLAVRGVAGRAAIPAVPPPPATPSTP